MTLNLNYFVWIIFSELWNVDESSAFLESWRPQNNRFRCCVQRQSCVVRKGCQWPRTCFFFKPLLCVGTKQLLCGTPLGFACHTKSCRWRRTQLQYTHHDAGTEYVCILISQFFHTQRAFRVYLEHRATTLSREMFIVVLIRGAMLNVGYIIVVINT